MKKPTVLCVTESSYLSSGYGTYTHEVLKRLHKMDLFNIIEFSSFGDYNDPRIANIPWKFISNLPNPAKPEEDSVYHSCSENKFGAWKFEEVCLKVKPDIVFSFRDWWADSFIFTSPFRDFYHYACMPTADGSPLNTQWVASYMEADAVFAYNDWSLDLLKNQSGGKINTICSAPPGADTQVFKKVEDRNLHQQNFLGVPPNSFIIGSTMRNMKRKLYPDIIECFERFLKEGPSHLRNRSYLYLHTAYPDAGWDIPKLLKDYKVAHKTFFTYLCRNCNKSYASLFQDSINICKHCSNKSLMFADSGIGISRGELASVMNCFDVYLQISNCEGFGMPQVEAASCEIPVFSTDYSAMTDVVRKLNGVPINVIKFQREAETNRFMAIPDVNDLFNKIMWFSQLPKTIQNRMGYMARKGVLEHYTYEKTAKIWADHFLSVKLKDHKNTWFSKSRLFQPNTNIPNNLSNEEFIRWCVAHVLNKPEKMNSYLANRLTRDLNWGTTTDGLSGLVWNDSSAIGIEAISRRNKFTQKDALEKLLQTAEHFLMWEKYRLNEIK